LRRIFLCLLFGLAIWFVLTANASSDSSDKNHNQKDNPKSEKTSRAKPIQTRLVPYRDMTTSWYGAYFQGKPTASGVPFDLSKMTAAHKYLPFDTRLELINPRNNKRVEVTITDRGPYVKDRDLDITYAAAKKLGMTLDGVVDLKVSIIRISR